MAALLKKLTKREREIVTALVAGSRLVRLYSHCCNTYRIRPKPVGVTEYVQRATLDRMKASGILRIGNVGGMNGYLPTEEAAEVVRKEGSEHGKA